MTARFGAPDAAVVGAAVVVFLGLGCGATEAAALSWPSELVAMNRAEDAHGAGGEPQPALVASVGLFPAGAAAWELRDGPVLDACGMGHEVLHQAAALLAEQNVEGRSQWSMLELRQYLGDRGFAHPHGEALTLRAMSIDRQAAARQVRSWVASLPAASARYCGVASARDSEAGERLTVVTAPVRARFAQPVGSVVSVGAWLTVAAVLEPRASGGDVVVLGPVGAPRTLLKSFDPASRLLTARVMADRAGIWRIQVLGDYGEGPWPVLEALVRAGELEQDTLPAIPGCDAGAGMADDEALLYKLNAARTSAGLAPLVRSHTLDRLAQQHTHDMLRQGRLQHDTGQGSPQSRAASAGLTASEVGENVTRAKTPTLAHQALWSSLSHRKNMLHPRYRHVGIGTARDERGDLWATLLFSGP